jgi:hypothetical protein
MNVNNLLEGAAPYQVLADQSAKLAGKWSKSGLLEGIESSTERNNMAMLLENQAKQLVNESNTTGTGVSITAGGNSEAWAGVALPLVRRVFGEIVAKDLISVQPMNLPAGLIFYLDFQYGTTDATGLKGPNESLYGAESTLKRTDGAFNTGLYGAGEFGYSMETTSSAITSIGTAAATTATYTTASALANTSNVIAAATFVGNNLMNDTEFSGSSGVAAAIAAGTIFTVRVATAGLVDFDAEGIRAFGIDDANDKITAFYPQYTRIEGDNVEFVVKVAAAAHAVGMGAVTVTYQKGPDNLNDRGDFEEGKNGTTVGGVSNSTLSIPEINVSLRSDTVAAKTRKLKAQWTPEFAQDLNAYHSIDAEAELTSILSEYISMEIDLEILDMLIKNADTVEGWSAKVGNDVTVSGLTNTNTTAGGTDNATFTAASNTQGVYYTKMSWFQTLGIKLQKVSNLIHQKTLRGGANWLVVSPKVSTILESIPGFAADSAGDSGKYNMGVQKIGAINNRYTVYKNPYMTENVILMGYKGSQFLETGAVFAPYIPLIMTPLVYDPASFTPRKGIMTRYAKKMVRPDFYGKVVIGDLNQL